MTTERIEDYLEAIFQVQKDKGFAQVKDVSNMLDIGPSSVSLMFKKLQEKGYIKHEKYGGVILTNRGMKIGRDTMRKHIIIKELLTRLGVDDEIADIDACRMEHCLHEETLDKIIEFLDNVKKGARDKSWKDMHDIYLKVD